MTKSKVLVALAAAALVGFASSASALPLPFSLEVDSSLSKLTLKLSALSGAATGAATTTLSSPSPADGLDGTIDLANYAGNVAGNGATTSGGANLSNQTLSISLGFLGSVDAGLVGVHASIGAGVLNAIGPQVPGNPGSNTYDIGGTSLTLDAGVITYAGAGPIGGLLGSGSINPPIAFNLPSGTLATVKLGPGPGSRAMTLTIPVNITTTVVTDPIAVDANLAGQIVFTGVRVPEPGTIALLAIGLVGLVPVVRSRFRKNG